MKHILLLTLSILVLGACTPSKPTGFALDGSPIRYETKRFESPDILAEVNGLKFTRDQILDKSPVIKDLEQQRNEAMIGLIYMKAVDRQSESKTVMSTGKVEVYLPASERPLEQILARFDRKPVQGITLAYVTKAEDDGLVGKLGTIEIKSDDIDPNNALLQSIELRRFTEIASQFNRQLSRILVNEEANKAKTPIQEYIDKTVLGGQKVSISEEELQTYLKKIGFAQSELTPELKTQFTTSLAQNKEQTAIEAYVAKNILKGPVAVSFAPPTSDLRLSEDWKPVAGYADAPIAMVAFAGTTCPDCPAFIKAVKKVVDEKDGYLKLNWIHNFNANDGVAAMMAQAALCIDAQKPNKSLEFLNEFSQNAAQLDENAFYGWTKGHDVDTEKFKACFVGQSQKPTLDQHLIYVKRVGVVANPSLWIDGRMLEGIIREEDIKKVIDDKIAEKQISPMSAFFRRVLAKFR